MRKTWLICILFVAFATLGMAQNDADKEFDPAPTDGVTSRATGGPDIYGYTWDDGVAFDWVDISTPSRAVTFLGDDELSADLPIGFSFDFYGQMKTTLKVSSNGFLQLGIGTSTDLSNDCPLPNTNSDGDIIGVHWDDLDPGDSNAPVYYETFAAGTAPYGGYAGACMVITFENFDHWPGSTGGTAGTFQAILFDNGNILIQFLDPGVEAGSSATTGIENADETDGLTYACDTADYISAQLAVMFYNPNAASASEVPAMSTWGLIAFVIGLLGIAIFLRRRTAA